MLLSRFWYLVLAALAALCLALALLATSVLNRRADNTLEDQLRRDRREVQMLLQMDARARVDALSVVATDEAVRENLTKFRQRRKRGRDTAEQEQALGNRLQSLNQNQLGQLSADLMIAVDSTGKLVAALGLPTRPPADSSLAAFPIVDRALSGYVRDDYMLWNGKVYRMAARPIIGNGGYLGAVLHGMEVNDAFAQKLGERIRGATVVFFARNAAIGTHAGSEPESPSADDMLASLEGALGQDRVGEGKASETMPLRDDKARGLYSKLRGSAASNGAAYGISRPRVRLGSAWDIFDETGEDETSDVPWLFLGLGALALFLISMFLVWAEHDRPIKKLRKQAEALEKTEQERFDATKLGGAMKKIALSTNEAMDRIAREGGGGPKRSANLDEVLGPEPEATGPSYFGFASEAPSAPANIPQAPGPLGAPPPPPPASASRPGPPPAPPGGRPGAPMRPLTASNPLASVAAASPFALPDDDEPPTTIQAENSSNLAAAQAGANAKAEEDRHFREVFEQFLSLKRECGENVAGLTYERMLGTLQKNRDKIIAQHGVQTVRFTVYKKGGKAALKATPVR